MRGAAAHSMRLFFALWPGDACRAALARAAAPAILAIDGTPVPPRNLHVTLAFLGVVPGRNFAGLVQIGGHGPWPDVALKFGSIEFWAKPRVAVAVVPSLNDTARSAPPSTAAVTTCSLVST